MPASVAIRRDGHASLIVSLARCADALLDCNDDPRFAGPRTVGAALDLADALHAWARAARWHQATGAAGVSWPAPRGVSAVDNTHSATIDSGESERSGHGPLPDWPDWPEPIDGRSAEARAARRRPRAPVQRSLLLPIATPIAATSPAPAEPIHARAS